MQINLLYFARLREAFQTGQETLTLPDSIQNVADLVAHLSARGGIWANELAANQVFRVAVDQDLADFSTPLHEGAEVAIFPPVTGG
ncbi:molybdopterin converting factor subunit 1 [Chitinimonas sp. BJB300]|uniref:molybdopterin converting factor subunit 1 n=1 Tax=Chitinimonas sp. BJB300 TaxID=1559339 RepID=UPI000C0EC6BC|nr:molybdopterin converting factor subunit 1 [Chitinimonas sp. BJB300]PHV13058.1 molybdopterin converting factor subunit 1 [Chitinimonas sp. BJB300]TSJ87732.1 molybdopterin converting factor subunit 1 [Chitinimonas sp. BJB300]